MICAKGEIRRLRRGVCDVVHAIYDFSINGVPIISKFIIHLVINSLYLNRFLAIMESSN